MVNSKLLGIASAAFALTLGAGSFCSTAAAEDQEPVVIKFSSFTTPTGSLNSGVVPKFVKNVEEASEGTIKFKVFMGGTLGSPATQLKLVEDGVADIAQVVASYTPGRFPGFAVFELPFGARNNVEGSVAAWRLYEKGFFPALEEFHVIGLVESGPYGLHGTFPIEGLDSLDGKKIRAGGPVQAEIVEALGAVPVGNIAAPSIGEAVSRGVLDGTLMSVGSLVGFRISDAAHDHLGQIPMGSVSVPFLMSKKKYESLPDKAKAALDKYSGEWFSHQAGVDMDKYEADKLAEVKSNPKNTFYTLDDEEMKRWEDALKDVRIELPNGKGEELTQALQSTLKDIRAEEGAGASDTAPDNGSSEDAGKTSTK